MDKDKLKKRAIALFLAIGAVYGALDHRQPSAASDIRIIKGSAISVEQSAGSGAYAEGEGQPGDTQISTEDAASHINDAAYTAYSGQADTEGADSQVYSDPRDKDNGISELSPGADKNDTRIDLNTADSAQLQSLKGIGPAKAAAIIAYRESYGGFVCAEEITEVKGIGPATYEKIKDQIYVEAK